MSASAAISCLRGRLASPASPSPRTGDALVLGQESLGRRIGAAFAREALHEVYAATSLHAPAADGFGLALALRAARPPIVWIHETRGAHEAGGLYGVGLHEWGLAVEDLLLIRVGDPTALLAAGEDALRSGAAGAVLMSGWGEARAFTLTASRRLSLAAAQGRSAAILVRAAARPQPSAAETRWRVEAAPSTALEVRAPGRPAFRTTLLRSRAGVTGEWIMEWDREQRSFVEPAASGGMVPVSARRPAGVRAA